MPTETPTIKKLKEEIFWNISVKEYTNKIKKETAEEIFKELEKEFGSDKEMGEISYIISQREYEELKKRF